MSDPADRKRPRVTIKDVATAAGVTAMTVSNVINGKSQKVSPVTAKTVEDAISRLGYRVDLSGRRLRLSRQFLVEMIVADPSPTFFSDPFTTSLIAGLSNYLNQRDYGLIIHGASVEVLRSNDKRQNRSTDGACVLASGTRDQRLDIYARLAERGDPFIAFQDDLPPGMDAASVRQDDTSGGALLARHLLMKGCNVIVWLTQGYPWPAFEARAAAVAAAIGEARPAVSLQTIALRSLDDAAIQAAVIGHIKDHGLPDAFMCANDQIGIAVLNWLIENGYRVPEDVKITGFNAFDFWRYTRPTLTTIQSPAYAMGELGGQLMLERLDGTVFRQTSATMSVAFKQGGST